MSEEITDINGIRLLPFQYGDTILVSSEDVYRKLDEYDSGTRDEYCIISQRGGQTDMLSNDADIVIGGGSRGGPLVVDTRVVTPFGYRRIGDLKAGDIISGTDGGMQRVVYRQDHGLLPCYKLKFIDGSEVIASYDHLWNVRKTCYISKKRKLNGLSLEEDYRVWTTQMIVDYLTKIKSGEIKNSRLVIPLCEPIHFTNGHSRHGIDPYLLGVIIGDGCITDFFMKHKNVMFTTADKEILDAFKAAYPNTHQRSTYKDIDYIFKSEEFVKALKDWKLAGHKADDKFVPSVFKNGTIEERWAILQGLMDTDGTIDKRGHCSFTTISEQLAKDVKYLVNSLGGLATITKGESHYTKDGEQFDGKDAYHIYIRIKDSQRLFRLPRKKALCADYNGGISEVARHIVDFEYVGEKECCCIAVNNTNSLFMVEDFVVTHNSKSYSLLLYGLNYVYFPNSRAIIFRHAEDDLQDIKDTSYEVFGDLGTFKINSDRWDFKQGGWLQFDYYGDDFTKFETRFRGRQFAYIGVDEVTQMDFSMFKFICTCNRNAYGYRNRFFGTCNPDPDSWVRQFIDWWIANEDTIWPDGEKHPERAGIPDPSRNGRIRYCFMDGDAVDQIVWGDTREEVFEQCKDKIMSRYDEKKFARFGTPAQLFIKSVAFVEAKLGDNIALMASDPNYLANLLGQSESQRSRDLDGNWNYKALAKEILTRRMMDSFYTNSYQFGDRQKYCSCDAALDGGDNLTMWLWEGYHVKDLFVSKLDSKRTVMAVKAKLAQWGVPEQHFTYDLNGIGQLFKGFFPNAVPFNNREAPPEEFKDIYANVKSMAADLFVQHIRERELSIDYDLLKTAQYGKGYSGMPLRNVLDKERLAIAWDDNKTEYHGAVLIRKPDMKKLVGHSPDFIEGLFMRMIFDIKHPHRRPIGLFSQSRPRVIFSRRKRIAFHRQP